MLRSVLIFAIPSGPQLMDVLGNILNQARPAFVEQLRFTTLTFGEKPFEIEAVKVVHQ